MNKPDSELICECVAGDTAAFDVLVLRYQDRLFNALMKILRNRDDCSEVVQEAFVTAWKKLDHFRGEAGFYSWLFRIAYHTAISRGRKKKVNQYFSETDSEQAFQPVDHHIESGPSHRLELTEQQQTVQAALQSLPEDYRMVLVLKEMENFKYEQIAEILDVPLGTIRSRIHRARQMLKEALIRLLPDGTELSRVKTS